MDRPFRRIRRACRGGGCDGDRFGYRVIRNSLPGQQKEGGVDPTGGPELARGVFAVPVNGRRLDPQAAGDLLRIQMGMDEAKAFALAVSQTICTARHVSPPRFRKRLKHGRRLTETGIVPNRFNQRLSAAMRSGGR